jgi:hypothetical protein
MIGDASKAIVWNNESGVPPFTRIDVFDSRATNIHVDEDLRYVYTPSELARFPRVQKGVDWVKTTLEAAIKEQSKSTNQFTAYFTSRTTKVFPLVELLGASTDIAALESLALVTQGETAKRRVAYRYRCAQVKQSGAADQIAYRHKAACRNAR